MSRRRHSFPLGYQSEASFDVRVEDSHERLSEKKGYQLLGLRIRNAIFCLRPPSPSSSTNNDEGSDNNIPAEAIHFPPTHSVSNRRRSHRTREISTQALLYVGSYVISYGFVWAQSFYILIFEMQPPLALMLLASIFFPLQGFINIFIYCRPHIVSLQRDFPDEYNWFQAFVKVLKSGGDDPFTPQERRLSSMQRVQSAHHSFQRNNSSNNSIEMDNNGFDSSHLLPGLELKDEMCGKRSSTTFRTDIQNQSGEELFRGPWQEIRFF
jgi:hypothetical protein